MRKRTSPIAIGRIGEEVAAQHLITLGYRILHRNLRLSAGEIDIIALDGDCLVFVEVKTRRSTAYGTGAEAVTIQKQRKLLLLAHFYLTGKGEMGRPCRFDVVAVAPDAQGNWRCEVITDAFDGSR